MTIQRGDVIQLGRHRLMCGDAATVLPHVEDIVDGVVTDPPFGIGFKYNDHNDTPNGYGEWLWEILEYAETACAPGAPVFVWQAMPNIRHFSAWFPRDWRIFAAAKNFVQMRKIAMQYSYDPVVVWWTEGPRWSAATASRDFHLANTSPSSRRKGAPDHVVGHPCPRPLAQVEHILEQWIRPGGVVLDPFAGSGTTLIAAERTGRTCMAVEKDPAYCQVIIDRYHALIGHEVAA